MTTTVWPSAAQEVTVSAASRVRVAIEIDSVEHHRRALGGAGAITQLSTVEVLHALPLRCPRSVDDLSRHQRRIIAALDDGVCVTSHDTAMRMASPPVRPLFALVSAREWATGLERVSVAAPYCARAVILTRRARSESDLDTALVEAMGYGVGLYLGSLDHELAAPRPYEGRSTAVAWHFAERLYALWLVQSSCVAPQPSRQIGGLRG